MKSRNVAIFSALFVLSARASLAQEAKPAMAGTNVAGMTFISIPVMPSCTKASVQTGDPAKGPSIIFAKADKGCTFPWHWHTPNEHLMMVSGTARVEMKDGKPATLKAGAFALMPSKHVHRFTCESACGLYVYSDAAFDMHYIDAKGAEITPEVALKAVHEAPAPAPKS